MSSCPSSLSPLACPICTGIFSSLETNLLAPISLPCCGRSICRSCYNSLFQSETKDDSNNSSSSATKRCPFDQMPLPVDDPAPLDRGLIDILCFLTGDSESAPTESKVSICENDCPDSANAVHYCVQCNLNYCVKCSDSVHMPKALREHRRIPANERPEIKVGAATCLEHASQPFAVYCRACQQCACSICVVLKHQSHPNELVPLQRGAEEMEAALQKLDVPLSNMILAMETRRQAIAQLIAEVEIGCQADLEKLRRKYEEKKHKILSQAAEDRNSARGEITKIQMNISKAVTVAKERKHMKQVTDHTLVRASTLKNSIQKALEEFPPHLQIPIAVRVTSNADD